MPPQVRAAEAKALARAVVDVPGAVAPRVASPCTPGPGASTLPGATADADTPHPHTPGPGAPNPAKPTAGHPGSVPGAPGTGGFGPGSSSQDGSASGTPGHATPGQRGPSQRGLGQRGPGQDGSALGLPGSGGPSSGGSSAVVCAYVPVGSEPGSLALLDTLVDRGSTVLLPIVVGAAPLDWAEYDGTLVPGPHGLRQPGGPRLGPDAIGRADVVLVPALAVDRRGVRLGRGGGHYDRSLPLARPGVPLIAVVRDDELVDHLPADPHDVLLTGALTPSGVVLLRT